MAISLEQARAAKDTAKAALAHVPGVVGVGITKVGDDYALKVNLREALPKDTSVPGSIAGVPVTLEVVGPIRKRE